MQKVLSFMKKEPVLIISGLAAIISCFFVLPDKQYINYIDFRTLALLYCLMTVVAGLRQAGVFEFLANTVCKKAQNLRLIGLILILLCFFTSMLITNDVALLTFVPFAVIIFEMIGKRKELIRVVVLQTVAANLGSMLLPVGNPQNLYLYSYYDLGFTDFIFITLPIWAISLILVIILSFSVKGEKISVNLNKSEKIERKSLVVYPILFIVCMLTVIRVLPWYIMLIIIVLALVIFDRKILLKADFMLLLTFVAFFVFSGNLARIPSFVAFIENLLKGKECITSVLTSQIISNVPSALLLSGFTDKFKDLICGVNIGGLGTPIASLASIISLKIYANSKDANTKRYLIEFSIINFALLAVLLGFYITMK